MQTFQEYLSETLIKQSLPELQSDDIIRFRDKSRATGDGFQYRRVIKQPMSFMPTHGEDIQKPPTGTKVIRVTFLGGRAIPKKIEYVL